MPLQSVRETSRLCAMFDSVLWLGASPRVRVWSGPAGACLLHSVLSFSVCLRFVARCRATRVLSLVAGLCDRGESCICPHLCA